MLFKGVNWNDGVFEFRHALQKIISEDFDILSDLLNQVCEYNAVETAIGVVGHHHSTA